MTEKETAPLANGVKEKPAPGGISPCDDAENSPEEEAFVRAACGMAPGTPVEMIPTGKGGSDRSYFRVVAPGHSSVILMRYGEMYEENKVYASVARFLDGIGVRVPLIHGHDPAQRLLVMEDMGDVDLYSLREEPWEERRPLYEKTLSIIVKMHAFSRERIPESLPLMAGYDESLYRWERDYFREHLVGNVCGIKMTPREDHRLELELAGLASRLLQTKTSLIHRDFQSQNVMIAKGSPALIDFQGMRPGCFFYDLGSLLYDPYVAFPPEGRDALLRYYYDETERAMPRDAFRSLFLQASAQRLMQALGAYGFLGLKRGKPHFLCHIAPALRNLEEVSVESGNLPALHALARCCRDVLDERMPV